MEKLKTRRVLTLGIMLIALFALVSSCSKDDEIAADYIGTWVTYTTIDDGLEPDGREAKVTMTFTANSFNNLFQVKDATTGNWVDYFAMKGSLSVTNQLITGTTTEIGLGIDLITGEPTGTMTFYKAGSPYFDLYMEDSDVTFNFEYSVSGNTLTLKTDDNNDGDYLDEGETETLTRQ